MSHFNFPSWLQLSDVTSILLSYLAMQHINTVKTPLQADELNRGKVLFSYHINRCRKIRWNQNILSVEKTSFFKLTKRENEVQVHLCVFACSHASNGFLQVLLCVCVCVLTDDLYTECIPAPYTGPQKKFSTWTADIYDLEVAWASCYVSYSGSILLPSNSTGYNLVSHNSLLRALLSCLGALPPLVKSSGEWNVLRPCVGNTRRLVYHSGNRNGKEFDLKSEKASGRQPSKGNLISVYVGVKLH